MNTTVFSSSALRTLLFWSVLAAFLAWDWTRSPALDLTLEPPLIAAGSGQAASGGHCSMAK
jgi:hypothetical protein